MMLTKTEASTKVLKSEIFLDTLRWTTFEFMSPNLACKSTAFDKMLGH